MNTYDPLAPLPFFKMHGLGNDFVVIDARGKHDPMTPALARAVGDRHCGVGFDQLVVIRESGEPGVAAAIDFWNADGSMAGACGNATRCVADVMMAEIRQDEIALRTQNGILPARRLSDGRVEVNMGPPKLDWRDIPLAEASFTERIDVKLGPIDAPVLWGPGAVNMGNPHAVFFVEDAESQPITKLGPFIENHPMFPERTNVEFAHVIAPDEIRVRVWERGAGVTMACGSGACAAVVAGVRRELIERRATVWMDGGALDVEWREEDDCVYLTGPTQMVFAGVLSPDFIATA
ncbi:MAG: diaminopimelate epimerase [Neomegalonema sp.]|nr:diaminopimelate epimerase [Neomegalonema sp.]